MPTIETTPLNADVDNNTLAVLSKMKAKKIYAPINAAAITNGWDLQPLREEVARMSDEKIIRHALVFHSKMIETSFLHECMEDLYCSIQWNGKERFRDDIPMWVWRGLIEAEGVARGRLPCYVRITTKSPFGDEDKPKARPKPKSKRRACQNLPGRTAGDFNPEEQQQVYEDYKDGLSYSELEEKYGMRPSNGMNSYRIVKKMES